MAANSELQDWPRAPCTGGKESLATGLPGKASLLLVVSHLRIFCQIHNHEDSLWFLPRCFIAIFLAFTHFIHFLIFCKVSIHLDAFACGYPTVPAPFVEKTTLVSIVFACPQISLDVGVWVYFWAFSSIPSTCIFTLCQCQCLDYCCFAVSCCCCSKF